MKTISKYDGDEGTRRVEAMPLKYDAGLAAKKLEAAMDETHRRATEVGPVLEGILHLHCEPNERWLN